MIVYSGKSISEGIAFGKIKIYERAELNVTRVKIEDTFLEMERFAQAKKKAFDRLQSLYNLALDEAGSENAAIFEIQMMMLDDFSFIDSIENIIVKQGYNAEYAVFATGRIFCEMFGNMDDAYLNARSADVRDISERLIAILTGIREQPIGDNEPSIIFADDITPSEAIRLNKENILAFATVHGSASSHSSILAHNMNMPAIVGADIELARVFNGRMGIIDGYTGRIYIDPDKRLINEMQQKHENEIHKRENLLRYRGRENITLDGRHIKLYANVSSPDDIDDVLKNDAGGIGLFRSEFIYIRNERFPTEDEQFEIYKSMAEKMNGKEVIIRTLDIGADKRMDYLELAEEENPALGCRGIRFCLQNPDIFMTQLRALYRASVYGNISVMYPMITSVIELSRIKKITKQVTDELDRDGIPYINMKHGVMIETPAAVMVSDLLARECDFLSIGTNDLSQYTMVVDRKNDRLSEFFDPLHISLFRMIKITVDNAHLYKKPVGICGEMASDANLTQIFLSMGVDELSVVPSSVFPLRSIICETNVSKIKNEILRQLW